MSDTTPESDPAHLPSIDEIGAADPAPPRRVPDGDRRRTTEVGFGLTADTQDLDLFADLDEPDPEAAAPLEPAPEARMPALLAPLSAFFYLIATRERTGPTGIAAKKRENPRLYLACIWGDYAYRVLLIGIAALVAVLIALRAFGA